MTHDVKEELYPHYHYKWTKHTHITKVLFLSKLVNIQLCISTHDKECIKLQKRQRPCSIILKCVVGHGHTKMNATTFVTSACGIIYFRIKFWIVHVAVVLGFMFYSSSTWFFMYAKGNNTDHDRSFLRLVCVFSISLILTLTLN